MFDFRNEKVAMLVGLALLAQVSAGQSFNVDLDTSFPPQAGGGVPSDSFGGAANQPGRWNSVYVIGHADWLYDLNGVQRNVSVSIADSTGGNISGGGFVNATNTGDYAKLLNDAAYVDGSWRSWTFHGLTNGQYRVVTYAVRPFPISANAQVSVNSSSIEIARGPMPGNQLIQGVTHTEHFVNVVDGILEIHVSRLPNSEIVAVNGFQITAVPEPGSILFVSAGLASILSRRKSRK